MGRGAPDLPANAGAFDALTPRELQVIELLAAGLDNGFGAMITACEPDQPADVAGLMSYDAVVRLDGEPVTGVDDLIRRLNAERIGRAVKLDVLRRGQLRSFEVNPTERRSK